METDENDTFLNTGISYITDNVIEAIPKNTDGSLCYKIKYEFGIEPSTFKRWVKMCEELEKLDECERISMAARNKIKRLEKRQIKGFCKDCENYNEGRCLMYDRFVAEYGYCHLFDKISEDYNV